MKSGKSNGKNKEDQPSKISKTSTHHKLNVRLDLEDYLTYYLFEASRSDALKKRRIRHWISVPVVYLITSYLLLFLNGSDILRYIFMAAALLWVIFYPFYSKWAIPRYMKRQIEGKYKDLSEKSGSIEVGTEITLSSNGQKMKVKMSEIRSIENLKGHYIIGITSGPGIILPKKNVDEKELLLLVNSIEEKSGVKVSDFTKWSWR